MNAKTVWSVVGVTVLLLVALFFWAPLSDAAYNAINAPRLDERAAVETEVTPQLEENLTYPVPSGSVSSENNGFGWASWHSGENRPYYYRFENFGEKTVYARSRLFTKLIGSTQLELAPKQVVYFRLVHYGPSTWLTGLVNVSATDTVFSSTGVGTSMTLVMPYAWQ